MRAYRFMLAVALLVAPTVRGGSLTNIYSTDFEVAEGYDPAYELVGQSGWVCYPDVLGGNGLITNGLGGQAAYVGYFPLTPRTNYFNVWHPIHYAPPLTNRPVVHFSVEMSIEDSTQGNNNRDDFYWSVYNSEGHELFTIDFNNYDLNVYYGLDDTNGFRSTGLGFTNSTAYTLAITLDLAGNRWSATLSGALLARDQPITTVGAPLDLGDIDAVWAVYNAREPGDNFMVFDHYQVTADAALPAAPRLSALGRAGPGLFLLRLTGTSGARYAIEATTNWVQWTALKTNVVSDSSFDFIDSAASLFPARFYRGRLVP